MRTIDGSEGGGQLLRTALSLAAISNTPFRIESIRGSRPESGLRPQHLAAVDLVADLCDATVEGAELGAESLTFEPGEEWTADLRAGIDTAGSATLLLDAVLPIAAVAEEPFSVTATGGTDVKWSPTVAYLRRVKLPLLARFGLDATVDLVRSGFYPAGGGEVTLRTSPSSLSPIRIERRGDLDRIAVYSKATEDLDRQSVADRQADRAAEMLTEKGLPVETEAVEYVDALSTGSSLLVRADYERTTAGFDALGERGLPSEEVAEAAVEQFTAFQGGMGAVDEHMADQVLPFLALSGGRVAIPRVTDHVRTTLALLDAFGCDVTLDEAGATPVIAASPRPDFRP